MGGIGILLPGFELLAYVDQPGNMTFKVNGASKQIEQPYSWPNAQARYEPYVPGEGQVFTLDHPPIQVKLAAVKELNISQSSPVRGHFELVVRLTAVPTTQLSGVIGETMYEKDANVAQEYLDATRYEVPTLSSAVRGGWAARRLLTASSSSDSATALPDLASIQFRSARILQQYTSAFRKVLLTAYGA